jgi:hypothetical protein
VQELEGQPKREFYWLVAEMRGTTADEEERVAVEDGFDALLDRWIRAYQNEDYAEAVRLRRSDPCFHAIARR